MSISQRGSTSGMEREMPEYYNRKTKYTTRDDELHRITDPSKHQKQNQKISGTLNRKNSHRGQQEIL